MKIWKRVLQWSSVLLSLAAVAISFAQSGVGATVSWAAPILYSDGSSIAAGELDHYTVTWTGNPGPSGSLTVPGTALLATLPINCGSANITLTVTTSASAKYPNATSGSAGPVVFNSLVKCTPNPPSALAVRSSGTSAK